MEKAVIYSAVILFVLLLAIRLGLYLHEWYGHIRYLKLEVRLSKSPSERMRWKRELLAVKLSLIPFLTPRKAKKILEKLGK